MTFGDERLPVSLWQRVRPDGSCWRWVGNVSPNGYGRYGSRYAHRMFYEALVGPVPTGLDLDHLCRNRWCCRPLHLEPVTRTENLRRGAGPAVARERTRAITHCPQGHPYSGENLYSAARGSRGCRICQRAAATRYRARRKQA